MFDGTFFFMVAALLALAAFAHTRGGSEELTSGLRGGFDLLVRFGPILIVSFLVAGLAERAIPQEWVREQLGRDSGLRGILIASGAGLVTPAGPFVSMPIAAVMIKSGAAWGPVIAFLAAWSLLALHRFIAWEVPILGWHFAAVRYATCLALPILAGLAARLLTR